MEQSQRPSGDQESPHTLPCHYPMCVTNYVATSRSADTIDLPESDMNPHCWTASGAVESTCLSISICT
jgi:hypothetical protein